jgi:hypothetical protein
MTSNKLLLGFSLALCNIVGMRAETIAAGTTISVRTNDAIDARDARDGRVYSGIVDLDVVNGDNRVLIPRGSDVELMVRQVDRHTLALDLDAVVVHGTASQHTM